MRYAALALLTVSILFVVLRLAIPGRSADAVAEGPSAQLSPAERETPFDGVRY